MTDDTRRLTDRSSQLTAFQTIFSNAPGMLVVLTGPNHVVEAASASYLKFIGGRDVHGMPLSEAVPELQRQGFIELLDRVFASGEAFTGSAIPVEANRNGVVERQYFDFTYQPLKDANGRVTGILASGFDVTALKVALDELQRKDKTLQIALSAAKLGAWERDLKTGELTASDICKANLGLAAEAPLTFEKLQSMRHPDDVDRVNQAIRRAVETGAEYDVEYRVHWPDGSVHWILGRGNALYEEDGSPSKMIGVTLDITAKKEAEETLREAGLQQRAILDSALDSIIATDHRSCVLEWNPAAERTFGYTRSEVLGKDLADLIIPPELRDAHRQGMKRYLSTGTGPVLGRRVELEGLRANGERFPVELAIEAVEVSGASRFVAYLRDISERRAMELALQNSEQRLNATYEHAFVGISEIDTGGRFLRVNEELCRITGFSREELLGRRFSDITHAVDVAKDLELFEGQLSGDVGNYTLEKRYLRKDGQEIWIELSGSMVRSANGQPLYGVRVVRDISERRRAERQQTLLLNELNHRVKNTLATVQSIVAQTLKNSPNPKAAMVEVNQRLIALSRAHDVLTRNSWEGADLKEIVSQAFAPYAGFSDRLRIRGKSTELSPRAGLAVAMALQELLTNAIKYGALSTPMGGVDLTWVVRKGPTEMLQITWQESGGPAVTPPTRKGFGTRLIEAGLARDLNGTAHLDFAPSGLRCTFVIPLRGE